MSVTGYLALYTTLIGWQQYQNLWELMVGTGLVFIPFIGIVLKCFLEPFESQEPKSASVITLRRLMIHIVGALLVIEFCCVPTISLDPKVLHYEPACVSNPPVATPGNSGTTYDNQFTVPTGVKVPILWYLVMAVSNGFTHAAIQGLSCQALDYRELQTSLNVTRITDEKLKQETIDFYNDCYVPSYSHYMAGDLSDAQKSEIANIQSQYGKDDLGWIGSQAFLQTPGFYDRLSAQEPVAGFAFDSTRDQFAGQVKDHSQWGQPGCQAWWGDSSNGLQGKLEKVLPPSFLSKITHISEDQNRLVQAGIRNLIQHSFDPGMTLGEISRGYESLDDDEKGNWFSDYVGSKIGLSLEQLHYYPKLTLLINALPVIQALLLLSIYALLALVIPFSSYRLHFIITGSAIIFAITFWSYLWQLVLYLDNTLIPAIFPSSQAGGMQGFVEWLQGDNIGASYNLNATFVDFIIGTLYVALPLLFLVLMTWAGLKVSHAIMGAMSQMNTPGADAGSRSGALADKAIMMAANVAKAGLIP